jgi:hypothetical protein
MRIYQKNLFPVLSKQVIQETAIPSKTEVE